MQIRLDGNIEGTKVFFIISLILVECRHLEQYNKKQKGQKVCRRNKSFFGLRGRGGNRRLLGAEVFVVRKGLGVPKGYSGRKTNIFYT